TLSRCKKMPGETSTTRRLPVTRRVPRSVTPSDARKDSGRPSISSATVTAATGRSIGQQAAQHGQDTAPGREHFLERLAEGHRRIERAQPRDGSVEPVE